MNGLLALFVGFSLASCILPAEQIQNPATSQSIEPTPNPIPTSRVPIVSTLIGNNSESQIRIYELIDRSNDIHVGNNYTITIEPFNKFLPIPVKESDLKTLEELYPKYKAPEARHGEVRLTFGGLVIDINYNLFLSLSSLNKPENPNRIIQFNPDNKNAAMWVTANSRTIPSNGGSLDVNHSVEWMAIDQTDTIYATSQELDIAEKFKFEQTSTNIVIQGTRYMQGFKDSTGKEVQFKNPTGIALDQMGNLYVADSQNFKIFKITPDGIISTLAGNGTRGFADGPGDQAQFNLPLGIALDKAGNLYVTDSQNFRIRKITPGRQVSTLAGNGTMGFADGPGDQAQFNLPLGIALDKVGNVYITDIYNNRIRKITPEGMVSTLAGNGIRGLVDGLGTHAQFDRPSHIAIDQNNVLYVLEDIVLTNEDLLSVLYVVPRIRKITL